MMKSTWVLCAVIAVVTCWLTTAELAAQYRWVDGQGTVHYSQFPPPATGPETPKDSAAPSEPQPVDKATGPSGGRTGGSPATPRDHIRKAAPPSASQDTDKKGNVAAFSLADVKYFHRFTKDDQHEYTPEGQEDLNAWTDMTTIHYYRKAKDGEGLAAIANAVLENYKAHQAKVIRADSVPKTKDTSAEHLIVVIFGRPEFIEVAFARFRMHDGVGTAVIYSHRVYGNKVGNAMSKWLEKNGPDTERKLLKWDAMPKAPPPR